MVAGTNLHLQRAGITKNFRKKCFQDCSMCTFQILKIFKGHSYVEDHARVLMALGPIFLVDLLQIHYRFPWHKIVTIHKENELIRRKVFINTRQYEKKDNFSPLGYFIILGNINNFPVNKCSMSSCRQYRNVLHVNRSSPSFYI